MYAGCAGVGIGVECAGDNDNDDDDDYDESVVGPKKKRKEGQENVYPSRSIHCDQLVEPAHCCAGPERPGAKVSRLRKASSSCHTVLSSP